MLFILKLTIVLSCTALVLAHYVAFAVYTDRKLDQLLTKRYTLEWNQELDALAKCNDRIQFWLRVQKYFKL
jgi:hypothetical protein